MRDEPFVTKSDEEKLGTLYDMLEAADPKTPMNTNRRAVYVSRMMEWRFPLSAFSAAVKKWVDNNDRMPSVGALYHAVEDVYYSKQNEIREKKKSMEDEAMACFNYHKGGYCAHKRGKQGICKHCLGLEAPQMREDTHVDFMKAMFGDNAEAKQAMKERIERETREDMTIYKTRDKQAVRDA